MRIELPLTKAGYETFIKCKRLPFYSVHRDEETGSAWCETDEVSYAAIFEGKASKAADKARALLDGVGVSHLFDFQRYVLERALERRRFASFLDCGLGKTPLELAWAHAVQRLGKVLFLCPLAVLDQIQEECQRFHGHKLVNLRKGEPWSSGIAIMNYEARREIDMRGAAGLVLDEASILKNADGKTRDYLCALAANVDYRLAASATPAPNEQSEYASQAVFLGLVRTAKEFWSRFFRKDGTETILRGHAVGAFYRYLSSWATYIHSPSALGFSHTTELAEPPELIVDHVKGDATFMTAGSPTRNGINAFLFGALRSQRRTPRMDAIQAFADFNSKHGVIAWALRNDEERAIADVLRDLSGRDQVAVINGPMAVEERVELIQAYRRGEVRHIVSKPKVLGFGVNLPECDRMVYSGYDYSFESYYQAVRRAHRYGRDGRLKVLLPCTPVERPVLEALLAKEKTFAKDVLELQSRFWSNVA